MRKPFRSEQERIASAQREYSDIIIAMGAAIGDQASWKELIDRYGSAVRSTVSMNARGQDHLWDDIEQDAWANIVAKMDTYNFTRCSLATWINRIATWTTLNFQKDIAGAVDNEVPADHLFDAPSECDAPDDIAARNETASSLLRVIESMPLRQRQAARLVFVDGKGLIEAARIMGLSKQRVHQMLYLGSPREVSAAEKIRLEMPRG